VWHDVLAFGQRCGLHRIDLRNAADCDAHKPPGAAMTLSQFLRNVLCSASSIAAFVIRFNQTAGKGLSAKTLAGWRGHFARGAIPRFAPLHRSPT